MKTFLSILGGVMVPVIFAGACLLIGMYPYVLGFGAIALCALAVIALLFRLGFTFTRDVILGGR